jgi:aspartate/glutamate/glutamine transport system permease protein
MDFTGAYSGANLTFILEGFWTTVWVAAVAIAFSFILGLVLGVLRYTRIPGFYHLVALIVDTVRNLPLLLLIFFAHIVLPQVGIKLGIYWSAIAALTVFEGAMISEIVRGGLASINKGQIEAARSTGLTYAQTLWHITLPQALRRMSPPLVSQFISLLKDTSLAVIISLPELMHNVQIVGGHNFNYVIPVLMLAAVLYFAVNFLLSVAARKLEARQV